MCETGRAMHPMRRWPSQMQLHRNTSCRGKLAYAVLHAETPVDYLAHVGPVATENPLLYLACLLDMHMHACKFTIGMKCPWRSHTDMSGLIRK